MARPRDPLIKTREEDIQEKLEAARKARLDMYTQKQGNSSSDKEKREAFRIYWAQMKKKFNAPKEIEDIIWAHLKAIKHDAPENFEKGIAHFGIKQNS